MPREYANIHTSIWGNPDVRALPLEHQGLYLQLWTHPELSYAGVLDWRPGRNIAPLSNGSSRDSISALIPLLVEHRFVIVDEDTEEILLRSYFRHDGLLKNPKTAVSMAKAYAATGSNKLRQAIIFELLRLREEHPGWAAWSVAQVLEILKHPASNPFDTPKVYPTVTPKDLPSVTTKHTATTTSTTTASLSEQPMKATRLPKDWAPTPEHFQRAKDNRLDLMAEVDAFRDHATTYDRHTASWNSAFTTWLKKSKPTQKRAAVDWMNQ